MYINFFQSQTITHNENLYGFELVYARPNRTYIEVGAYANGRGGVINEKLYYKMENFSV
jgi:hypothetical protein